jgi:uncharacterized protein YkwD
MVVPLLQECVGQRIVKSLPVAIILCMAVMPLTSPSLAGPGSTHENRIQMDSRKIIVLINAYRSKNGLSPLRENPSLGMSTILKVNDMVRRSYFGHTSPEGRSFSDNVKKARYNYRSVAEVLARGCRDESQVVRLWTKSSFHKDALLNPSFQEINCSSSSCAGYSYVACHLAWPRSASKVFRH